jgi:hypothetical protein
MKEIKLEDKKEINAGIGEMMAWIAIVGVSMLISGVTDMVQALNSQQESTRTHTTKTSKSSTYRKNGYLRISPFPSKTSFMMEI